MTVEDDRCQKGLCPRPAARIGTFRAASGIEVTMPCCDKHGGPPFASLIPTTEELLAAARALLVECVDTNGGCTYHDDWRAGAIAVDPRCRRARCVTCGTREHATDDYATCDALLSQRTVKTR